MREPDNFPLMSTLHSPMLNKARACAGGSRRGRQGGRPESSHPRPQTELENLAARLASQAHIQGLNFS